MSTVVSHYSERDVPREIDSDGALQGVAAWFVSLVFHFVLLLTFALISIYPDDTQIELILSSTVIQQPEERAPNQDFLFSPEPPDVMGAGSIAGSLAAMDAAPVISEVSQLMRPPEELFPVGRFEVFETADLTRGVNYTQAHHVRGEAGVAVAGAEGAIDRLTHEILLSLEERKTLVVWLFDQSQSLAQQRDSIRNRFEKIYQELGLIQQSGHEAFGGHRDRPLLTSIGAFGQSVSMLTRKPTDDLGEIQTALANIEIDNSGVEKVFSAIYQAARKYKTLRRADPETGEPYRNVMIIVVTDEVGDDQDGLDQTVQLCRNAAMPVYVIGIPAPFGQEETLIKWVDPNPEYDQRPRWGRVNQGPESLLPERLKLHFSGTRENRNPIDSGFGPFALTRLCVESGGIYFAIHPNRHIGKRVSRSRTNAYSSHLEYFFDPEVMRRYRPDYISAAEYNKRLDENLARRSLVTAARMSWVTPMEGPRRRFVKTDDAAFASELTEAQKVAAKLEPKVESIYQALKPGESQRPAETESRWQAGYDLAMGRVLAVKVRTEAYNAMLAKAKRGLKFTDPKNNTWTLKQSDDISVGSQLENHSTKAKRYLQRVVNEHPNTPWALLAQRELKTPLGWTWEESFTDLSPPAENQAANNNPNPPPPRDDQRRMIQRKPRREIPKL